jgi:hypothetical protein
MNSNKTVLSMSVVIILLAGLSIAQYLQINQQSTSVENLKAEILAELRQSPASPRLPGEEQYPEKVVAGSRSTGAVSQYRPPEPPKAISDTQYWISKDFSDDKPFGYSAWAELVAGGNLIVEKCLAPDYSNVQISAENPPEQIPECTQLINSKIASINKAELVLDSANKIPMTLEQKDDISRLTLTIEGTRVVLEPGSKNTLWEGLIYLPSVKQAYQAAWEAHSRMRNENEMADQSKPQ